MEQIEIQPYFEPLFLIVVIKNDDLLNNILFHEVFEDVNFSEKEIVCKFVFDAIKNYNYESGLLLLYRWLTKKNIKEYEIKKASLNGIETIFKHIIKK